MVTNNVKNQRARVLDEDDVWLFVYDLGDASFTDIEYHFVRYGPLSHNTCGDYRESLEAAGKIRKRLTARTGDKVYFVPQAFRQEVETLKKKRKRLLEMSKLSPEKITDIFETLEKKVELYERQRRIEELQFLPLPTSSVISYIDKRMKKELGWKVIRRKNRASKYRSLRPWTLLDSSGKKIDVEKLRTYDCPEDFSSKPAKVTLKIIDLDCDHFELQYAPYWKILFRGEINGEKKMLIGAYTELLKLIEQEFGREPFGFEQQSGFPGFNFRIGDDFDAAGLVVGVFQQRHPK